MSTSNQGSDKMDEVFEDVPGLEGGVNGMATERLWKEVRNHPETSSCFCPAIEFLCALYELGYKVVKKEYSE